MAKQQYRKSVSLAPEDYLLLKKLDEKLGVHPTMLVTALVRTEAKKRRVKVTEAEVEEFKAELRGEHEKDHRSASRKRAEELYPDAFK